MSKRIEQSRRHGHHDPRYLVLVPQDPPTAPDGVPQKSFIGPESTGLRLVPQQAPLATQERVQL